MAGCERHEVWLVNGRKTSLRVLSPEDPKGTIIYSHGLFISSGVEDQGEGIAPFFNKLAKHWRVVRYDARGHGASEEASDYEQQTWKGLGKDINAIRELIVNKFNTGTSKFILAGLSMGVGASLHAFCSNPTDVAALLFIISPTAWELRKPKQAGYTRMLKMTQEKGKSAFVTQMHSALQDSKIIEGFNSDALISHLESMGNKRLELILEGTAHSDFPSKEQIANILDRNPCPMIQFCSKGDPGHPWSVAAELHRLAQQCGCSSHLICIQKTSDLCSDDHQALLCSL
mmetsp:Transcript_18430/g.23354  ORF Transcript_18430/g.23354 Transcript_18430/m.23354 type:complete len:287 (-) Transcript_18430:89-949(-)